MSFTYNNNPTNDSSDAVRFEVGDTIDKVHLVEDEQIAYALAKEDNNVLRAAARVADALAARFARQDIIRTGSVTTDKSSITQRFIALANRLRQRVGPTEFVSNLLSKSGHDARKSDSSIVQPSFKRGMDRNTSETTSNTNKTSDI